MRNHIQQFLHNSLTLRLAWHRLAWHRLAWLLAALLLPACSDGGRMLPLLVRDCRGASAAEASPVDIYAVRGEAELLRQTITPVDEYFASSGLPSRPVNVIRCYPDRNTPTMTILPQQNATCRAWLADKADTLIAVTPKPARRNTTQADPRRVTFPLSPDAYPPGTQSLVLSLTDVGLTLTPSSTRLSSQTSSLPSPQ